jgi:antitoxin component HigA of HigAB toxin-antitoxin module
MYPNLKAEMARYGIKTKGVAEALGITSKSVTNKINGRTSFTIVEVGKIKKTFFPKISIDDLFSVEAIDETYRIPAQKQLSR